MKRDSYLFHLQSLDRPAFRKDPSSDRRSQVNFSEVADSTARFPKQKISHTRSTRSKSIPVPTRRLTKQAAKSEITLAEEEFLADVRDFAMFTRIVKGMADKASLILDPKCRKDIYLCLAHVIATRYLPKEELDGHAISKDTFPQPFTKVRSTMNQGGIPLPVHWTCALGRLSKDDLQALIHRQDDDCSLEEMFFEMDL